ncbi:hypothetical protein [Modestobacter marinus]|uniref:hypothetical protein n=1 Tax=Modestobacter marinus TaxID=477641 RepID=UPI001C9396DE|nr:hypothetical protein [Modestobacter marinus]
MPCSLSRPSPSRRSPFAGRRGRPLAVLAAALVLSGASSVSAAAHPPGNPGDEPTVVLVHGAVADASSWSEPPRADRRAPQHPVDRAVSGAT